MITIYYDTNGNLLPPIYLDGQSAFGPDTGSQLNSVGSITFDESTNKALLQDINTNWSAYTVVAGNLQHNGQAVTIAADSTITTERTQVISQAPKMISDLTTYINLSNPTASQTTAAVQDIARAVRYLIRHIILE